MGFVKLRLAENRKCYHTTRMKNEQYAQIRYRGRIIGYGVIEPYTKKQIEQQKLWYADLDKVGTDMTQEEFQTKWPRGNPAYISD